MEGNRQARLPLKREDRLSSLQAIDRKQFAESVSPQAWRNVVELLTQIELCTGRDGCFAYTETLAARMFAKSGGVSRATFFRAKKLAHDLGLLRATHRFNNQGQQSNEWFVEWDRVMVLAVRKTKLRPSETHPSQGETHPCQVETGGSQVETPLIRNNLSSIRPLVFQLGSSDEGVSKTPPPAPPRMPQAAPRRTEARRPRGWVDWEQATRIADSVEAKIGRCRTESDRSLLLKAAALMRKFGEHWLWDSVEAVVRARERPRPFAYLHTCLAEKCASLGVRFNRELAALEVPPDVLAACETSDLTERLCVVNRSNF